MTTALVVAGLAGLTVWAAVWVFASPLRIAAAGLPAVMAHPALTVGITAAVTAIVVAAGVVIVWRALAESGWLLIAVQTRPAGVVGVRHG